MNQILGGSREPPLHFAGRRDELRRLQGRLAAFRARGGEAARNGIELIVGPPGSGKSATMERFAELADEAVMRVDAANLAAPESSSFMLRRRQAWRMPAAKARKWKPDARAFQGGALGVRMGTSSDVSRVQHAVGAMLSDLGSRWPPPRPLVLLIDEMQNVDDASASVMRALHNGVHNCPIMVVCAGLRHTPTVFAKLGICRTEPPMRLTSFDSADAEEAVTCNLEVMGRGFTDAAVVAISSASHGFPAHIHGYLAAVNEIVPAGGTVGLGDSLCDILRMGDGHRAAYYDSRLAAMAIDGSYMPKLAAEMPDDCTMLYDDAAAKLNAELERHGEPPRGKAILESAIAHGVLAVDYGLREVSVEIPSFHSHLRELHKVREERSRARSGMGR